MNNTWKVSKYLIQDFKVGLLVFYCTIIALAVISDISISGLGNNPNNIRISGLDSASVIFIFIAGLNCFKTNFRFMQANNISRKRFYAANIIALSTIAVFMAAVDTLITAILSQSMHYESIFTEIYKSNFYIGNFVWSFTVLVFAVNLGWLITMLYYRCNNIMKTVISIAPVLLIILLNYIDSLTIGVIAANTARFFSSVFALESLNPYVSALNILVGAGMLIALCYPLIYKAPVKD